MVKDAVLVFVTCASAKEADKIADILLRKKLAACVNVLPGIRSKFWWKGKLEKADEILVMAKTRKSKFAAIDKEVRRIHSYEVPEVIALPIIAGSGKYLKWIADSLK